LLTVWNTVPPLGKRKSRVEFLKFEHGLIIIFRMLEILAIGFAIFIVLKLFEGPVVKLLPSLLLASVLHAPKLITYVPEAMDANRTGIHFTFLFSL
jgi:hypothetical protein